MRTLTVLLSAIFFLFASSDFTSAQAINDKDVSKLVDDYVADSTSETRRADIELKLLRVKPALTTKAIKAAMGVDKKRKAALDLAVRLWTPGVFSAVKKYTEGELCAQIVKLALQRQEKEAVDHIIERWKQAAPDSAEFAAINEGLKTNYVDLSYADKMKASLSKETDETRRAAGGEVLGFQLQLQTTSLQDVLDGWNAAMEVRQKDSKRFPIEGRDLWTVFTSYKKGHQKFCGANVVLAFDGDQVFHSSREENSAMPELSEGAWTFTIRVFVKGKSCKCEVGVNTTTANGGGAGAYFRLVGTNWVSTKQDDSNKVSVKFSTWCTLTIAVGASLDSNKNRLASFSIDGKKVQDDVAFGKSLLNIFARCDEGEVVFSGFDCVPG